MKLTMTSTTIKPSEDYDLLKKQFYSLQGLLKTQQEQLRVMRQREAEQTKDALIIGMENLNSEREMNAILTEENERLQKEVEQLKDYIKKTNHILWV